jgi:hypothetical protein
LINKTADQVETLEKKVSLNNANENFAKQCILTQNMKPIVVASTAQLNKFKEFPKPKIDISSQRRSLLNPKDRLLN